MSTLKKLQQNLTELNTLNQQEFKRGSIVMVELPSVTGSIQNGLRPCVVISNNKANKYSPIVIVVPLTSKCKKQMPTHYTVNPSLSNGLKSTSIVLAEQILTVSKDCMKRVIGILDSSEMKNINHIIKTSIDLF